MKKSIFAIIGAGNGGQGLAAYFSIKGYEVRIFDFLEEPIKILKEKGEIVLEGAERGVGKIAVASNNIEEVISGADVIMVVNPSIYHRKIAEACAPYIENGQIIFLHPASVFGAFAFKKALEDSGCEKDVTIAESNTLLFACRAVETGRVYIGGKKDRLLVAAFPACDKDKVYDIISPVIEEIQLCETVLETSMDSTNSMVHPLPTIMNSSWSESGNKFKYYHDGIGETVGHFIEGMDAERIAIGEKLGLTLGKDLFSLFMEYEAEYNTKGSTISQVVKSVDAYADIYAASTAKTRYVYEDVPMGLVPFMAIGELIGLPVDKMKLTTTLCEEMFGENLSSGENCRSLENLGLQGMSAEQIIKYAKTGVK